jgi:ribosomal protein L37AE/L43A
MTYSFHWDYRVEAAHRILKSAADQWSHATQDPSVDLALAVIVRLLTGNWFSLLGPHIDVWARSLSEWVKVVESLETECGCLSSRLTEEQTREVASRLRAVLNAAAAEWREGDPEEPLTSTVLNGVIGVVFDWRLVERPPNDRAFMMSVEWRDRIRNACPCCDYQTLRKRYSGVTCPICGWKDTGLDINNLDTVSGENGLTLRQARQDFDRIGACDDSKLTKVLPVEMREQFRRRPRKWLP